VQKTWEDSITLNSAVEPTFEVLSPAASHFESDSRKGTWDTLNFAKALKKDTYPLPMTKDREGYYGEDHFSYWASGLQDTQMLLEATATYNHKVESYLDFGCASGRVIRHFAIQHPEIRTCGCDINRLHVEWCNTYLPSNCIVFQNHSIPTIPLPDASLDLISAFSVFTHTDAMETTWLMEIVRLLRPGGLAWLTVHTDGTLHDMDKNWPLWKPTMDHPLATKLLDGKRNFDGDRIILRWHPDASYSSNVFYKQAYINKVWGRILNIVEFRRRCPNFQDVVLVQKPVDVAGRAYRQKTAFGDQHFQV